MKDKIYIARIVIETTSPLFVGTGKSELDKSSPVSKDFNNLPYIPGTSLTGVLRSIFENKYGKKITTEIFGGEEENKKDKETFLGSSIIISDALLALNENKVIQELQSETDLLQNKNIDKFFDLPKREHVRINDKGVAEDAGKFDNEFVYKGSRFKFEIKLSGNDNDKTYWEFLLNTLKSGNLYFGGGTTNNFGNIKTIEIKERIFDLTNEPDLNKYLDLSVDLNSDISDAVEYVKTKEIEKKHEVESISYQPKFFHIGAGYGNEKVDAVNYKESVINWKNGMEFKEYFVIPGTSIKGALSHRTAFYANKGDESQDKNLINFEKFEEKIEQIQNNENIDFEERKQELEKLKSEISNYQYDNKTGNFVGEENEIIKEIFGYSANDEDGQMGNIIVEDVYIDKENVIPFNFAHNKINRFTAGTIDGALFSEEILYFKNKVDIKIKKSTNFKDYQFLNKAIDDIKNGNLPLGGKTNYGYGFNILNNSQNEN